MCNIQPMEMKLGDLYVVRRDEDGAFIEQICYT